VKQASDQDQKELIDADAVIEAASRSLGLVVDEASRPHVKTHLQIAARMAALILEHKLDDREEPAPVFKP
jgi:Protein of unknown function (DUF4089)